MSATQTTILLQAKTEAMGYPDGILDVVRVIDGDRGPILLEADLQIENTLKIWLPLANGWTATCVDAREMAYDFAGFTLVARRMSEEEVYKKAWERLDNWVPGSPYADPDTPYCSHDPASASTTDQIVERCIRWMNPPSWPAMPTGHEYD